VPVPATSRHDVRHQGRVGLPERVVLHGAAAINCVSLPFSFLQAPPQGLVAQRTSKLELLWQPNESMQPPFDDDGGCVKAQRHDTPFLQNLRLQLI